MSRSVRRKQLQIHQPLRGSRVRRLVARAKTRKPLGPGMVMDEETFDTFFAGNAEVVDLLLDYYAPRI